MIRFRSIFRIWGMPALSASIVTKPTPTMQRCPRLSILAPFLPRSMSRSRVSISRAGAPRFRTTSSHICLRTNVSWWLPGETFPAMCVWVLGIWILPTVCLDYVDSWVQALCWITWCVILDGVFNQRERLDTVVIILGLCIWREVSCILIVLGFITLSWQSRLYPYLLNMGLHTSWNSGICLTRSTLVNLRNLSWSFVGSWSVIVL